MASALLCPPPPKTPVTCSPSDGSCFTQDMAISPITSNKCIGLFTKFTSSENSTAKDLYLRFFNADTNQTTNNVSFFINVTKQDKILGHDLFYAHSGIFVIKFQPSVKVGDWIVEGDQDPVLGGFTSSNNTIIIYSSTFTNGGLYHIHTEVIATDHEIVNQTNTPKFDSWWSVDGKGNISKYNNSTISFGSTTPSVNYEPPLKQFKSGIAARDVKCNDDLQLIFKTEGDFPACVKTPVVFHLSELGWGYIPSSFVIKTDLLNSKISGGKIKEVQYDLQSRSIIIKIQTTSNGSLMVTIPKFMTDLNPPDKPFKDFHTVLADGMEEKIDLVPTANGSSFTIPFTNGTQEIEIIGNQVGQQS